MIEKIKQLFHYNRIELKLPPRWELKKCYDCNTKLTKYNFSGWEVFREIIGMQFSVKICNKCLKKQNKVLEKTNLIGGG
jgi:uncharacterized protein with PIN domain